MKKVAALLILLIALTAGAQQPKAQKTGTPKDTVLVENIDTVKVVSAANFTVLYEVLGDEIYFQDGRKKVFTGNDRELIMRLIQQYVILPAQEEYKKKKPK